MMNQHQAALIVFEEELGELAMEILQLQQHVSKAIRFGINEQGKMPQTNKQRIESEWNDLIGSLVNLENMGIKLKPNLGAICKKVAKIERYNIYSESLGQVTTTDTAPNGEES